MAPVILQPKIYDNGDYHSTAKKFTVGESFINSYTIMDKLAEMTDIVDEGNTFLMMDNEMTHEAVLLQEPEFVPSQTPTETRLGTFCELDGRIMKFNTLTDVAHYQSNLAAMLKLADWFDYMRENGVYDNTRIILVSDHGADFGQFDDLNFGFADVEGLNPVLMVKDFDSKGFVSDGTFMTNADVLTLAASGIAEVDESKQKEKRQLLTTSRHWETESNNGNLFDLSDGQWVTVHDNIFQKNNWSVVTP